MWFQRNLLPPSSDLQEGGTVPLGNCVTSCTKRVLCHFDTLLAFMTIYCRQLHHRHHNAQLEIVHLHIPLNIQHSAIWCEKFPSLVSCKFYAMIKFLHDVIS
jgi:hypothetical protein